MPALRALQEKLLELYAAGKRVVVMIDEAHAMPEDTLEQVRLLSNLESSRHKLLQIVLFGQPELDESLAKPSMRQLKDRITHSFRTRPLVGDEVGKYVAFRMRAAGYKGPDVFSPSAIAAITRASSGLSRRINVLCDKALLAAFAANTHAVTPREVRAAVADSDFAPIAGPRPRIGRAIAAAALLACGAAVGAGLYYWLDHGQDQPVPPARQPSRRPCSAAAAAVAPAQPAAPSPPAAEPVRTDAAPGKAARPPIADSRATAPVRRLCSGAQPPAARAARRDPRTPRQRARRQLQHRAVRRRKQRSRRAPSASSCAPANWCPFRRCT